MIGPQLSERLEDFLKNGKDWGRLKTNVPGIFVLKLPSYRGSPGRLAVELNPVDELGRPTKRRGLLLRSSPEMEEFKELLQPEKLTKLLEMIDAINPKTQTAKQDQDLIEI